MPHQITYHIIRNGDAFKNVLLLQDYHENISGLDSYIHKIGQDGASGCHPEVYAAAWFYGVNISIYAQENVNTVGFLVLKGDGPKEDSCNPIPTMWTLSYHGNCWKKRYHLSSKSS